jgi:hypothetical protein
MVDVLLVEKHSVLSGPMSTYNPVLEPFFLRAVLHLTISDSHKLGPLVRSVHCKYLDYLQRSAAQRGTAALYYTTLHYTTLYTRIAPLRSRLLSVCVNRTYLKVVSQHDMSWVIQLPTVAHGLMPSN